MKEKKYDLYFENSVKVKSLNDDYFKCSQEIEKALFKKQKNTLLIYTEQVNIYIVYLVVATIFPQIQQFLYLNGMGYM